MTAYVTVSRRHGRRIGQETRSGASRAECLHDQSHSWSFARPDLRRWTARAPELLTWRVRSWGVGLAFDAVADGQLGVGVAGSGLGELLAEGVEGAAAAGCGGGIEPDVQGVPGDVQVAGQGEGLPEQGAGFVVDPGSSAGAASGPGWTRRYGRHRDGVGEQLAFLVQQPGVRADLASWAAFHRHS